MSIIVKGITKKYGEQKALNNVSFEVSKGDVVGLLGPNGAGKSTMMKILTCFLPPTSGTALVNGFDVIEESIEVRKLIGYLPEHNPLYTEMYIPEYLEYSAKIYGYNKNLSKRTKEIIHITGLEKERKKKIGALSKGYRQRVGLAQALYHEPEILILDEPTSGLDPNQIVEIRNLIKEVGKEKTVLLSTHIMQEVEAICNKSIIINNGNIVAYNDTKDLRKLHTASEDILVEFGESIELKQVLSIKGVVNASTEGGNKFRIQTEKGKDIRSNIFQWAVDNKKTILSLQVEQHRLEEVFQKLTQK